MITNQNPVLSRTLWMEYEWNERSEMKQMLKQILSEHSTTALTTAGGSQAAVDTKLCSYRVPIKARGSAANFWTLCSSICERKGNPCTYPWLQQCNSVMSLLNTIACGYSTVIQMVWCNSIPWLFCSARSLAFGDVGCSRRIIALRSVLCLMSFCCLFMSKNLRGQEEA